MLLAEAINSRMVGKQEVIRHFLVCAFLVQLNCFRLVYH